MSKLDLVYLTEAVAPLPTTPLPLYLLGRRAWLAGRAEEAAGPLRTALKLLERPETHGGLRESTAEAIEREVWRMLGRILLQQGKLTDAEAAFARAAQLSTSPGARKSLLDWGARANWERQRAWLKGHGVF